MIVKNFQSPEAMSEQLVGILKDHLQIDTPHPHAVMLSGGSTPLAAYRELARRPVRSHTSSRLFFSDERMVPLDSPENNCANAMDMISAVGIAPGNLMRVPSDLPLEEATRNFNQSLADFFGDGGRVTLGLLGLGADGHTASLFSEEDVLRGAGAYAQAVRRPSPPDRVSVTRELLLKVEKVLFLASGPSKTRIIEQFLSEPKSIPAGQVIAGAHEVELWVS